MSLFQESEYYARYNAAVSNVNLSEMQALAEELAQSSESWAPAWCDILVCQIELQRLNYDEARLLADRAYDAFIERGEVIGQAMYAAIRTNLHHLHGELGDAYEWTMKALDLCEELDMPIFKASRYSGLGSLYMDTGELDKALSALHNAIETLSTSDEGLDRLGYPYSSLGLTYALLGDNERGLEYLERGKEYHHAVGNTVGVANVTGNIASTLYELGRLEEAIATYQTAIELSIQVGAQRELAYFATGLAWVLIHEGVERADEAQSILDRHADVIHAIHHTRIQDLIIRSMIDRARGLSDDAVSALQQAMDMATKEGDRNLQLQVAKAFQRMAKEAGDFDAYLKHGESITTLEREIKGAEVASRIAIQERDRAVQQERQKNMLEREAERALLYGALPKHIAERKLRGEDVSGDQHDRAAVLFLDIAGFTKHSSGLEPQQTTRLLDKIFHYFDDICARHDVTKIKTIGDSYMAVAFASEEDLSAEGLELEQRAASAALDMLASEFYWPTATADSNSTRVQFRVGIHSGPVVAGVIGKQRLQYDVWGDTVNVASRMESTGEPGRIQVSSAFAGQLRLQFAAAEEEATVNSNSQQQLRERGAIDIKGKGPMTTYWLEGA